MLKRILTWIGCWGLVIKIFCLEIFLILYTYRIAFLCSGEERKFGREVLRIRKEIKKQLGKDALFDIMCSIFHQSVVK